MAKPEKLLDAIGKIAEFSQTRLEAAKSNTCVACGRPAIEFRDELSIREWMISHLCQDCQDDLFEE